ncbi:hypothetical protein FRC06_000644 [Ceratobasidium sp. 370]|nr:hypothetical protein FRC06_000644 [Ceratobasidium sp. 370]
MSPIPELRPKGIDPTLSAPVKFCLFNIAWTFLAGEVTGNVSQVDRVWTFLPVLYSAYWSLYLPLYGDGDNGWIKEQGVTGRGVLMVLLQVIWSSRLSYNTFRRGLFSLQVVEKDEDYRWAVFRAKIPPWLFSIFNFGFIAFIQNVLLFLIALPSHHALFQHDLPLATSDYVLAFLTLCNLAIQFTADNQQHAFQSYKYSRPADNTRAGETREDKQPGPYGPRAWPGARIKWTDEDVKRGFVTKGLWAWSRHPNFICEQIFWFLQALFPILASTAGHHALSDAAKLEADADAMTALWPLIPPLALSALFIASTMFTESISKSKYPAYEAYQARVGMFSPSDTLWKGLFLWARGRLDEVNAIVYGGEGHAKVE